MLPPCLRLALGIAAALVAAGCSRSECTISGTVTYEGQPIQQGEITFAPVNGVGPLVGAPIVAGAFTVANITPGQKIVQISELPTLEFPKSTAELAKAAQAGVRPAAPPPALMPANPVGNGATIEIKSGSQSHDFHLKKPAT